MLQNKYILNLFKLNSHQNMCCFPTRDRFIFARSYVGRYRLALRLPCAGFNDLLNQKSFTSPRWREPKPRASPDDRYGLILGGKSGNVGIEFRTAQCFFRRGTCCLYQCPLLLLLFATMPAQNKNIYFSMIFQTKYQVPT